MDFGLSVLSFLLEWILNQDVTVESVSEKFLSTTAYISLPLIRPNLVMAKYAPSFEITF